MSDLISRQAAISHVDDVPYIKEHPNVGLLWKAWIESLPSVTPTRKKGKWINKSHTSDCGIKFVASECTCCGKKTFFDCDQLVYNYCPNCGAKMLEPQESEDEECVG